MEDEDAPSAGGKKKKKKPKKKKKAAVPGTTENGTSSSPAPAEQASPKPSPASPPATPQAAKSKPAPSSPSANKSPQPRASFSSSTTTLPGLSSTTSLPLQTEQTAQSAHKYLQEQGLAGGKTKVKTRAAVGNLGNLDAIPEKKQKGFWSAFAKKKNKNVASADDDSETEDEEKEKKGRFSGLSRRTGELMHQLLRTSQDKKQGLADMRWEKFVKVRILWYVWGCRALMRRRGRIAHGGYGLHVPPQYGRFQCAVRPTESQGPRHQLPQAYVLPSSSWICPDCSVLVLQPTRILPSTR